MNAYSVLEIALVSLIVAACAIKAFGRFAPRMRMRLQARLANALDRPGRAPWLRKAGQRLGAAAPDTGCGSGCGTCDGCGPADAKPVHLRR
ncbi:DUF6587 family protein [Pigmentiphaga sp.]|uniref:DUF6587 family protein n=1 Tax=Pigmentiphaga sp. TaxID=1977564 RepID=UPI0025DC7DD0|nr:DUF6587 family protein [Pigmentiphaga sp.]MBX6319337.1 hypothetical protein [Pigmentiphaga sp.]